MAHVHDHYGTGSTTVVESDREGAEHVSKPLRLEAMWWFPPGVDATALFATTVAVSITIIETTATRCLNFMEIPLSV